jgi:hypothetical protein
MNIVTVSGVTRGPTLKGRTNHHPENFRGRTFGELSGTGSLTPIQNGVQFQANKWADPGQAEMVWIQNLRH